jgi:hypothetical protein
MPSKSIIRNVVAFCVVVGIVVGIRVLPGMWARHVARQVAQKEAERAAQDAVPQAIDDVTHDIVRRMADEIARSVGGHNGGATRPAALTPGPVIDLAAFTITLPAGSRVDAEDPSVGKDRFTTANLPEHGCMIFVVADDKATAAPHFDNLARTLREKMQGPVDVPISAFDPTKVARCGAVRGTIKDERIIYEIAEYDGQKKACLVIVEYPEANQSQTLELARGALATLRMKD